ncbi:DUF3606 domain-containing protein [Methylobacter sp.]|uniref:DUF3606 domain-containing protein n=1 Tax=Methylobacter sp. TaxID=2051955 RepID=UPI002FDCE90B
MSDNLKIRQPEDLKQINVHEDWELQYWSNKFGITKDQLRQAVQKVGTYVDDVKNYLNK